ncbi:MAG: hypothetical protein IJR13_08970 [Bacteroidales bacterium]|nr:hypothetical protein [Bacteroidales bacterium]
MKKFFYLMGLTLVCGALMFSACKKEESTDANNNSDNNGGNNGGNTEQFIPNIEEGLLASTPDGSLTFAFELNIDTLVEYSFGYHDGYFYTMEDSTYYMYRAYYNSDDESFYFPKLQQYFQTWVDAENSNRWTTFSLSYIHNAQNAKTIADQYRANDNPEYKEQFHPEYSVSSWGDFFLDAYDPTNNTISASINGKLYSVYDWYINGNENPLEGNFYIVLKDYKFVATPEAK